MSICNSEKVEIVSELDFNSAEFLGILPYSVYKIPRKILHAFPKEKPLLRNRHREHYSVVRHKRENRKGIIQRGEER